MFRLLLQKYTWSNEDILQELNFLSPKKILQYMESMLIKKNINVVCFVHGNTNPHRVSYTTRNYMTANIIVYELFFVFV